MNKPINQLLLFFSLLFIQVFILNNILLFGYLNPYLYITFVFLYPIRERKIFILLYSFLLGLLVDFFSDTGGIHAFSITLIAYLRLSFIKIYFKKLKVDYPFFKLNDESFGKVFFYVLTLTIIHHFIYFFIANFSFHNVYNVLSNTILSSIFTLLLYFIGTTLFTKNN